MSRQSKITKERKAWAAEWEERWLALPKSRRAAVLDRLETAEQVEAFAYAYCKTNAHVTKLQGDFDFEGSRVLYKTAWQLELKRERRVSAADDRNQEWRSRVDCARLLDGSRGAAKEITTIAEEFGVSKSRVRALVGPRKSQA